jgi:hypothetical protein
LPGRIRPDYVPKSMDGRVPLYRAVNPIERESILRLSAFTNPFGFEIKYFSTTFEGAVKEGEYLSALSHDGPYSIFGTTFPRSQIDPWMFACPDRGIFSIVIPTEKLPFLSIPVELR